MRLDSLTIIRRVVVVALISAKALAEPAPPLPMFPMETPCDAAYDDLIGSMGRQISSSMTHEEVTGDRAPIQADGSLLDMQMAALAICREAQIQRAIRLVEPYGDFQSSAQAALGLAVTQLQALGAQVPPFNPGDATPADEYYVSQSGGQYAAALAAMRSSHPRMGLVVRAQRLLRDFANLQFSQSVKCRVLTRRGLDSEACHRVFLDNAGSFLAYYSGKLAEWAPTVQYFDSWNTYYEDVVRQKANLLRSIFEAVDLVDKSIPALAQGVSDARGSAFAAALAQAEMQALADEVYNQWMITWNSGAPDWRLSDAVFYYAGLRDRHRNAQTGFTALADSLETLKAELTRQRQQLSDLYLIRDKEHKQSVEALLTNRQNLAGVGL